jgi:hypothetical protein
MFKPAMLGLVAAALLTTVTLAQKPAESSGATTVSPKHEIPTDGLGNIVRISGNCNPKSETKPNGYFQVLFPSREARGVQAFAGKIAISGATIDRRGVETRYLIKSTTDYVTMNSAGTAVEFSTHSQAGRLKLPLVADKDSQVVVVIYLETVNGSVGFRYFLSPRGLSFEPVKKNEPVKKKEAKK